MKTITTVTIDAHKRDLAKKLGLNISEELDRLLTSLFAEKLEGENIDIMQLEGEISDLKEQITGLQAQLNSKVTIMNKVIAENRKQEKEKFEHDQMMIRSIKASGMHESLLD